MTPRQEATMPRKGKVKVKRGKVKIKLKSDDHLLLHGGDHIRFLMEAAVASVLAAEPPMPPSRLLVDRPDQRALPPAMRAELPEPR